MPTKNHAKRLASQRVEKDLLEVLGGFCGGRSPVRYSSVPMIFY